MENPDRDRFPVVVHVALLDDDRVFLLRRAQTGFLDGYYTLPGGHQHRGERVTDAALRELAEEAGVRGSHLEPLCVLPYLHRDRQGVNFVFAARRWDGEARMAEPDLFDDCRWVDTGSLPERLLGWVHEALSMAGTARWFSEL